MARYNPDAKNFLTSAWVGATGDGLVMAQAIGAAITEDMMKYFPTYPMGLETSPGPRTDIYSIGGLKTDNPRITVLEEAERVAEELGAAWQLGLAPI